jgi:hypothetical protein
MKQLGQEQEQEQEQEQGQTSQLVQPSLQVGLLGDLRHWKKSFHRLNCAPIAHRQSSRLSLPHLDISWCQSQH